MKRKALLKLLCFVSKSSWVYFGSALVFPSLFLFIIYRVILRDWCKSIRLKYIFATNAFSWKCSKGLSDSLKKAFSTWTTTNLAIQTNFRNCNRIYLNKKFLAPKSQDAVCLAAVCMLINKFQWSLHSLYWSVCPTFVNVKSK